MPTTPKELFRFAVGRAPREDIAESGVSAPESTRFVTLALQRATEKSQPSLSDVARAWLAGKEAVPFDKSSPLLIAANTALASLQARLDDGGEITPAETLAALEAAHFSQARGNVDRKVMLDRLWSTLSAVHCAAQADVGAMLGLTRAVRAQALEIAARANAGAELATLLRAPLKLPLSVVRAAYVRRNIKAAPEKPAETLKKQQRAEGQKLITLQGVADKMQRIARDRRLVLKASKNPSPPLTAAELKQFSSAEKTLINQLGITLAPLDAALAEVQSSVQLQIVKVSDAGGSRAAPAVKRLESTQQSDDQSRAALLAINYGSLVVQFGASLWRDGVINALYPGIIDLDTDALAEGLLPRIRPIGVLDLKLVELQLARYQLGDVAHIENVMASEFRKRVHKRTDTSEETVLLETQTTRENERNLESTERFEMQQEVANTISEQMQVTAGVQVSVNGPCFTVGANAGFSYSRATEQAQKFSSKYSKEVVDKTREKVETKVREQRQSLRRIVIEEGNTHRFDNTSGDSHKVGIYRFVDKVMQARLLNYGRRMMFEFLVPEPGAALRAVERQTSAKPASLPELTIGPSELNEFNYQHFAGLYGAREIEPPPPLEAAVSAVLARDSSSPAGDGSTAAPVLLTGELELPAGYSATAFRVTIASTGDTDPVLHAYNVGNAFHTANHSPPPLSGSISLVSAWDSPRQVFATPRLAPKLPAWVLIGNTRQAVASVTLECRRLSGRWEAWQNATFAKIKEAYDLRLADIQDANRRLESQQRRGVSSQNPAVLRRREREELTRGCINMANSMLLQGDYFDSLRVTDTGTIVDVNDALREGQVVRFFHGAFEWDNMTYELFPYFWGKRERWAEMLLATHEDTKYEEFLRSGFARVMVPVRPGQEHNVLNFLSMGLTAVFDGASEAVIDDPDFLRLLGELQEPLDPPVQEGEAWEVVVPTTLVKLQLDGEDEGLGIRGTG